MKKNRKVLVGLWEELAEELVRFPSPNLTRILEEVTEGGPDIFKKIQTILQLPPIRAQIKGLQKKHKRVVSESTKTLEKEEQSFPGDPSALGLDTGYAELVVIKEYRRTNSKTWHELLKTGRTHEEMMEEKTKHKYEQIWT
ncbi:uncharacterized protein LOC120533228 isoform X2 [Polypterus senegalus]|uniref:uncharacterized protein LOC120533228 isoform X2 n=1 Tax=Polypterus senegalus TaxID=55291 RepID=UPI0019651A06|nr:uncharacterized protein LOC120533228 isoform X2 [Polypterus senegalus]